MLKNSLWKNSKACQLLKARLCARSFTYIILFNPRTNSARFFLFYLIDEEGRLSKVKELILGHADHDRETGIQTAVILVLSPCYFH